MLSDFHLHSSVSDGALAPPAVLRHAAAHGLGHVSITDHDTLGAYLREDGRVFEEARRLGLVLSVGIELDVLLDGREVHLLGYDLDISAARLGTHLAHVKRAREERFRREIVAVREGLGNDVLGEDEVLVPGRETLMRPHLIRPLVERGCFATYQDGREWFREHVAPDPPVPKPTLAEGVAMLHDAGGWASLAHPGYYWKDGMAILERLPGLRESGLDAVELDYPYRSSSPSLFSEEDESHFLAALRAAGGELGMRFTGGSDAHFAADFDRVYGPAAALEGGAS
jgi:predicted metal-dependent phosphoesterase TrpH